MLIFKSYERVVNMMKTPVSQRLKIGVVTMLMTLGVAHNAHSVPAQKPLFQTNSVKPIMMLNMSKDHQMFFKAYDDYSNITDENGGEPDSKGKPDITYVPKYEYYGYFDGKLCYQYVKENGKEHFNPVAKADIDHYCTANSDQWSGNFLNWASMTRIDAIRKILYGGYRSTDTATETILERAFLPHDAHAFAKYYNGPKINQLTPFTVPTADATLAKNGITICNVTPADVAARNASQLNTQPPLLRVATGNYSLWASNETNQCQWNGAVNSNVAASSGIHAYPTAPSGDDHKLVPTAGVQYAKGEYIARVKACVKVSGYISDADCESYSKLENSPQKPVGLFQEFGETEKILFGLLTGSYERNKSGGVLRKTVGSMANEINKTTGEFLINSADVNIKAAAVGAISVLNSLRIYGYSYSANNYGGASNSGYDNCPFGITLFNNGNCTNWGNPQTEIYLESLRYLASYTGENSTLSPTPAFKVVGTDRVPGLAVADWGTPPVTNANSCAPLNVLQFNTSSSTFDDGDEMTTETDLGLASGGVKTWTDKIGNSKHEAFSGSYFVGKNVGGGDANDQNGMCTGKEFSSLSAFTGSCPDAPRLGGSYGIAGLAYYARTNDISAAVTNKQTVRTFGVSLAPAVPAIKISVPGTTKFIEILPACKNNRDATVAPFPPVGESRREGNCSIVDFKVVTMDIADANTTNTAKLYVNWEVAEQGNDYDQDMWGTIDIEVTNATASVRTRILNMSASPSIGFGYVISGTDEDDGFKASSGANNFIDTSTYCNAAGLCNCPNAACTQVAPWQVYPVADGSQKTATFLPSALKLAAKWGGFSSDFEKAQKAAALEQPETGKLSEEDFLAKQIKARDDSDSYYFATNPRKLADALRKAFNDIAAGIGAASSVATVSARVSEGSLVYQAQFNSENWTGNLLAYEFDKAGGISTKPKYCTSDIIIDGKKECVGQMAANSSTRTIYTSNGSELKSLEWGNLTQSQKNGLRLLAEATISPDPTEITYANAKKRLDWLAGNATYEEATTGGILRNRGVDTNRNILGDIVNSSPVYVADRNFRYESLSGDAGIKYKAFLATKINLPKYIIVGSNGGMVHAFDANTLKEKFAFMPSNNFLREKITDDGTKLTNLTSPTYGNTTANPHTYNVDGPITYSDVYITVDKVANTKAWRRVVVGTFGAGGRSIYALDVTEATPKLLFELNETDYPALGYVIGKPIIAPMKNGRWAVIFGNGSDSSKASHLFVVDLEHPKDPDFTKVISTGGGTGLSAPALLLDGVGQALTVYAGDIDGNLWRFNLNNTAPGSWAKDYKVFKAVTTADSTISQPITGAPTLGVNAKKGFKTMVYFGTGKYHDTGDGSANIPVQSFYGILDAGSEVSRSTLLQKTLTTSGKTSRTVSTANPNWDTQNGWYLDFNYSGALGERVTTKPLLLFDKLVFPTLIPTTAQCDAGGGSWLMEVVAVGDKYVNDHVLDPSVYDSALVVGNVSYVSTAGGNGGVIVKNNSSGEIKGVKTTGKKPLEGRESWRQIQ